MNTPLLRLLPVIILWAGTTACHKDHTPDAGGTTLDKTVAQYSNQPGVTSTTQFQYDAAGRLTAVINVSNQSGGYADSNKLVYDAGGKLLQHIFSNSSIGVVQRDTFLYDGSGRITRARAIPVMINLAADDHVFAWDAQGRLVADSQMNRQSGPAFNYHKYTYDAAGNVVRDDQYEYLSNSFQLSGTTGFSFDDHVNPFYSNSLAAYMVSANTSALCKNNAVTSSWSSSTTSAAQSAPITCSYYTNGQLRRTNIISVSPGSGTITTDYYYKAP